MNDHNGFSVLELSAQDHRHTHDNLNERATFTPTLVVAFVLFIIFGAYFFFRYAGARSKKFRLVFVSEILITATGKVENQNLLLWDLCIWSKQCVTIC